MEKLIVDNDQTTAYIKLVDGKHITFVRSNGVLIKTVPTDPSQIRNRVSGALLWKP